ncbi:SDR family oxidoreductase [Marinomonas sp. S3726]|uniref:SDR family NAD(P)-dependent oxidoreductase n=1 Tax=Marinomonas sp. S3726 TaxID=579484 RepID=UPI0005FA5D59|nr:SDR family oxidoreductase [Marinomonas sp. S3726]
MNATHIQTSNTLTNKLALVTGGGRGIGRGITECLLAAGAKVLIAQRQELDQALADDSRVFYIKADLSERQAPYDIASFADTLGGVDILVNNAGFMFEQHIQDMDEASWDKMMIVNLRAPVFLAKALLPQLKAKSNTKSKTQHGASIINIGSIEGIGANPYHTAYCGSKAGVHGATQALAIDLGKDGIRCNAIAPGWINSDLSNNYINDQADPAQAHIDLIAMHPVGRTGEPEDIGNMVVFLASEQASFIAGQTFVVDGGRTAKLPLPF